MPEALSTAWFLVVEVHVLRSHGPATVQESLRNQMQQRKVNHAQQTSA